MTHKKAGQPAGFTKTQGEDEVLFDGVLETLPRLEPWNLGGWNVNLGAGPGISPRPCSTIADTESPKTDQRNLVSGFQCFPNPVNKGIKGSFSRCFADPGIGSHLGNQITSVHLLLLLVNGQLGKIKGQVSYPDDS